MGNTNTKRAFSPRQLLELREQRGWSRTMLAAHLGVAEQTVRGWEGGVYRPNLESYIRMCEMLATDAEGVTDYAALLEVASDG